MRRICTGHHVVQWVDAMTQAHGNMAAAVGIGLQELRSDEVGNNIWKLIAGVAYTDFNGTNIVAHIASDGSKNWMTKEYLWTIFDYPFSQAKVNRITCMIGSDNIESINLCERLGFNREASLEGAHPGGDLLIYRLWKRDAKWLSLDFGKRYAKAA